MWVDRATKLFAAASAVVTVVVDAVGFAANQTKGRSADKLKVASESILTIVDSD